MQAVFGFGYHDSLLMKIPVNIPPDMLIRSSMTRLLCLRLGSGQSGATLTTRILWDGSPRPQADMLSSIVN